MTLSQIETNLKKVINHFDAATFIYDFLLAFNTPKSVIQRFKKGTLNLSKNADEIIWKPKLFYKYVSTEELQSVLASIKKDVRVNKNKIRFIIVTDNKTIAAFDTKTKENVEVAINDLLNHVTFFLPLAGMEKYTTQAENDADVKAAVQMAKLFDEIKKTNLTETTTQVHNLNVFLSRLLFCFFAEDTEIFKKNLFTSSINNHTQNDGSDLSDYLQNLFNVLNVADRGQDVPAHLKAFPYVNGGLFRTQIPLPNFTFKSRKAIIDSGGENWAAINPDIFGSMIQAVVSPDKRGSLGMHYTSVPNIMKVIRPLFLDELYEEFEAAKNNPTALNKLLGRIANIRIFDPACGSGNFLIIAYKELRYLEIQILLQLKSLQTNSPTGFEEKQQQLFGKQQLSLADSKPQGLQMELFSRIELNHFFGIELDDFAHEVAKLSLWLAQHQMNVEFNKLIGTTNPSLPLRDAGIIRQGNATRLDWEEVCPKPRNAEVFILGNPPYLGARVQDAVQKTDMSLVFQGVDGFNNLDYISCWFKKGCEYILSNNAKVAFVTTNSICQGEQVSLLWNGILTDLLEINFVYQSFKWGNNAKANAGVTCNIIGIRNISNSKKFIYTSTTKKLSQNINAYLVDSTNVIIHKRSKPIVSFFPDVCFGSMPNDGGHLILSTEEKNQLEHENPNAKRYIKKLVGAQEFLNGEDRYCLWIAANEFNAANEIPFISDRVIKCKQYRENSKRKETFELAATAYRFGEVRHQNTPSIIIPRHSSERREYIPFGFLSSSSIIADSALAIYNAELYIWGIISFKMHMCWIKTVGGKLETRIRYSASLCYNTFPFPSLTSTQKSQIEKFVDNIREERAKHTEKTLAELYDPEDMPEGQLQAHQNLDVAIEQCYRTKPFESDEERLVYLFKMYEEMIEAEKTKGTLFAAEPKIKKSKKK